MKKGLPGGVPVSVYFPVLQVVAVWGDRACRVGFALIFIVCVIIKELDHSATG
jgi:hypothetical protein